MKKVFDGIMRVLMIIPAMGGILIDRFNLSRIFLLIILAGIYLLFRWLYEEADFYLAASIFLSSFILRYLFLFSSFIPNGIADQLKKRYGEEKGFEVYKTVTAVMFFFGGLSFSLMIIKSGFQLPFFSYYSSAFTAAGTVAALTGIIINVWSTYLVGVDIYYYKDLFVGRKISEFKRAGPYKLFSNPMYGPGQANGYGTALTYGSAAGLTGMLMNQVMMYIFFYTIEKPHIRRILREAA